MYVELVKAITPFARISSLGSSLLGGSEPQHRQSSPRGTPLKFGWNRDGVAVLMKPAISLKRGKIGPRLLLMKMYINLENHCEYPYKPYIART